MLINECLFVISRMNDLSKWMHVVYHIKVEIMIFINEENNLWMSVWTACNPFVDACCIISISCVKSDILIN